MDPNLGFLPYTEHDAAAAFEAQIRKALAGRPAEFASASGSALAWEFRNVLSWIVANPASSFRIDHGRLVLLGEGDRNPENENRLPVLEAAMASGNPDAPGASVSPLAPADADSERLIPSSSQEVSYSPGESEDEEPSRYYLRVPATIQNQVVGYIHICCSNRMARSGLVSLSEYMLELVEKEHQETSLLQELSASWESLDALFEWTVDMRNLPNRQDMLNRIIERAVGVRPGAKAILWIEDEGLLLPTAWIGDRKPQPRGQKVGIVGRALDQKNSLILRRAGHLSQILDTEPELLNASSVVVVPVSTHSKLHGALEVWIENEEFDFETSHLRLLETLSMQAALVVENDRLNLSQLESERLRQEVDIGSRIQQALLFSKVPERIEGATLASLTLPSQTIDGDFYDIVDHSPHCFDVVVGDVMGKGVPAAILAAASKSGLFRSLCQLMVDAGRREIPQPDAIVTKLNGALARQMISVDSFASLSYARFDLQTSTVTYVDAGHTKTFHLRVRDHQTFLLQGENLPLGIVHDEVYQQQAHRFEPGDVLVFYSDGITEARDNQGEFYGEYRLYECVRTAADRSAQGLVNAIKQDVISFVGGAVFQDDLTCVVVCIDHKPGLNTITHENRVFSSDLRELSRIRQWVNDLWIQWAPRGCSEEGLYALVLAINELSSNVMRHAYRGSRTERIRMRATCNQGRFVVELAHTGEPFDPDTKSDPAFDGSRDGGFGLYIIENSVDEIVYNRNDGDWHTIRIEKSF